MYEPLVSIIIPTYNVQDFIEKGLDSLLDQTYSHWEILIIDDCSTDRTVEIIKDKYLKDPRIKIIEKQNNSGPANSRNIGIKEAEGKYIALLDGDDYYAPFKIERQVHVMENNPNIAVCSTFLQLFGLEEKCIGFPLSHAEIKDQQLLGCPVGHAASIFRTSFLKENHLYYDENLRFSEDYEFFTRILEKGGEFITIPEPLYYYRITGNQASFLQSDKGIIRNEKQRRVSKILHYKVLGKLVDEKSELYNKRWIDAFLRHQVIRNFKELKPFIIWAKKLIKHNEEIGKPFNSEFLEEVYKKSVLGYFLAQKKLSWKILFQYLSVYNHKAKMNASYTLKYIIQCLFFLRH